MMEWLNKMNDALHYLEANLAGKIDYAEAARIACCSLTRFQRMFAFMTDLTVGDYVRFRKMSLAAEDIKMTNIKVLDLALKYGYDSPEAFTRAFQSFHGIPPTTVRKLGIAKSYQPISFQIKIIGGNIMAGSNSLVRIEELNKAKVVSFYAKCDSPETTAWYQLREWAVKNLNDYQARRYIGFAPMGHHPAGEDNDSHEYKAQMILYGSEENDKIFDDAEVCDAPKGLFLVGDVVLNEFFDDGTIDIGTSMKKSSQTIYECMLSMGGYDVDFDGRTYLEEHIFPKEWFTTDEPAKIPCEFKFWLPIKKKCDDE